MEVDLTIKKPKNLAVINENCIPEILWWSSQLGVSPERILTAVKQVGSAPDKVKAHVYADPLWKNPNKPLP